MTPPTAPTTHCLTVLARRKEIAGSLGMNCMRGGYSRRWPSGVHRLAIMLWQEDGFHQLISEISRLSLLRNTLVVSLGDHGCRLKGAVHTASRIPLTIQWLARMPTHPNATGTSSSGGGSDTSSSSRGGADEYTLHHPVSTVDITPTILDAAGGLMSTTGLFDGVSLLPLLVPSHSALTAHHRGAHNTNAHAHTHPPTHSASSAHSADAASSAKPSPKVTASGASWHGSGSGHGSSVPSARGIGDRDGVLVDMCQQVGAVLSTSAPLLLYPSAPLSFLPSHSSSSPPLAASSCSPQRLEVRGHTSQRNAPLQICLPH